MTSAPRRRRGFTLVEFIAVLAVLAASALVVAIAADPFVEPRPSAMDELARLSRSAVRAGRDTTVVLMRPNGVVLVTAAANGRVLVDSAFRVETVR